MKLQCLLQDAGLAVAEGIANPHIKGVTSDSRRVRPDYLFVAVPGANEDGRAYIGDALQRGAAAIVFEGSPKDASKGDVRREGLRIEVKKARLALARLSAAFYRHPSRTLRVAGITGTNGKTSTAYLVHDMLAAAGMKPGMLGTVDYRIGERVIPASRTTPDAPVLHAMLAEMVEVGCASAVMEVSSHALAQDRTAAVAFDVAAFTNLTRDHLDYHGTMAGYFETKRRLFEGLGQDGKAATAVINRDDPWGQRLLTERPWKGATLSCGMDKHADIRAEQVQLALGGATFTVRTPWGDWPVETPLLGAFNVSNVLVALGCGVALGVAFESMLETLRHPTPIPGRMERVAAKGGATVFVDYAHTDDALACALKTLRPLAKQRVIVVFGCGGDRDKSKRPAMGQVAGRLADHTVLTSDNPRGEDPMAIIDDIRAGLEPKVAHDIIEDRRAAIEHALRMAGRGDVVLIAGKGHETFQQFSHRTVSFDDRQVVRQFKS